MLRPLMYLGSVCALLGVVSAVPTANAGTVKTFLGFGFDNFLFAPIFVDFGSPLAGELVEARITLDMTIDSGADINDMLLRLSIPRDEGGDAPVIVDEVLTATDFTLDGDRLFGEVVITSLNGPIFEIPAELGGWSLQVDNAGPGFAIFGEGALSGEFDVLVPEPTSLALLSVALLALRRRR